MYRPEGRRHAATNNGSPVNSMNQLRTEPRTDPLDHPYPCPPHPLSNSPLRSNPLPVHSPPSSGGAASTFIVWLSVIGA